MDTTPDAGNPYEASQMSWKGKNPAVRQNTLFFLSTQRQHVHGQNSQIGINKVEIIK